jgi:hypothetical protein
MSQTTRVCNDLGLYETPRLLHVALVLYLLGNQLQWSVPGIVNYHRSLLKPPAPEACGIPSCKKPATPVSLDIFSLIYNVLYQEREKEFENEHVFEAEQHFATSNLNVPLGAAQHALLAAAINLCATGLVLCVSKFIYSKNFCGSHVAAGMLMCNVIFAFSIGTMYILNNAMLSLVACCSSWYVH